MILETLYLQHFRSYTKFEFNFSKDITIIIGPNTAGKSNCIEAIFLLASGKSFRSEKDIEMMQYGEDITKVTGEVGEIKLEALLAGSQYGKGNLVKRYFVNGVSRRKIDFSKHLSAIIFSPLDLDIVIDSPGIRRRFLDNALEQTSEEYGIALIEYAKGIRQRNALLNIAQETGRKDPKQFNYWDELLIKYGNIITKEREEFINYINNKDKDIFSVRVMYDHSIISEERLAKYDKAEVASGVTLVGPHRDNFLLYMKSNGEGGESEVRSFGSRGQQRLVVLQLKMLQLTYIEKALGHRPLLLLDDIFSELDDIHIELISNMCIKQQTIITTTHEEFVHRYIFKDAVVIELKN